VNFHITHKNATLIVISKGWLKLLQMHTTHPNAALSGASKG